MGGVGCHGVISIRCISYRLRKKITTLKGEPVAAQEQKPVVQTPAKAATDDQAARERALREQALREQSLRDQAAKDAAAKAAKDAADRAKRDAAAKDAAILRELQIADIHFDFDKYNIKPEDQAILKAAASAYLKNTTYKLVIEGNCDERGTGEYNLALGQKRADVTAQYLIDLGIAKERIKTISYGKERPLDAAHNETAWAKNRRVHFDVVPPTKN